MNDELKNITEKLKIVKNMAQSHEVQQVCSIIIELTDVLKEKQPLGFTANESKRPNKSEK